MQVTMAKFRTRINDILKALDRNEDIDILYRGKTKGVLKAKTAETQKKVTEHAFFNMQSEENSVAEEMEKLRGGRYRDL